MFSEEIQKETASYVEKFLNHKFLQEISKGKLPIKKFTFYIQQDNIFLKDMDTARRAMASRKSEHAKKLGELIASVYRHELRARRNLITKRLELTEVESAPTTLAYGSYLIRLAYQETFEEAFAALIPCPRLYTMIGERYTKCAANKHPLYGKWLSIYSSKEMKQWTGQMLRVLDRAAGKNPSKERVMTKSYITACRYEVKFFDMAYNMEGWN